MLIYPSDFHFDFSHGLFAVLSFHSRFGYVNSFPYLYPVLLFQAPLPVCFRDRLIGGRVWDFFMIHLFSFPGGMALGEAAKH